MPEDLLDKDPFNPADDFFGELAGYQPEEVKDEGEFKPLKGSYVTIVKRLTHNIGISTTTNEPYDFYSLNLQVVEVIDGDKGVGRFLSKRYQNTIEGIKSLMNDLFTSNIPFEKDSREALDLSLTNALDKQVKIRAWSWSPKETRTGEPIPEEDRVAYQSIKIIKDFKKGKTKTSENIPF